MTDDKMFWRGKPIESLDREEILSVVRQQAREITTLRNFLKSICNNSHLALKDCDDD